MPAPLTARVELLLRDPLTNKPKHGERARITIQLWEEYLAKFQPYEQDGKTIIPLPELDEALYEFQGVRLSFAEIASLIRLRGQDDNRKHS